MTTKKSRLSVNQVGNSINYLYARFGAGTTLGTALELMGKKGTVGRKPLLYLIGKLGEEITLKEVLERFNTSTKPSVGFYTDDQNHNVINTIILGGNFRRWLKVEARDALGKFVVKDRYFSGENVTIPFTDLYSTVDLYRGRKYLFSFESTARPSFQVKLRPSCQSQFWVVNVANYGGDTHGEIVFEFYRERDQQLLTRLHHEVPYGKSFDVFFSIRDLPLGENIVVKAAGCLPRIVAVPIQIPRAAEISVNAEWVQGDLGEFLKVVVHNENPVQDLGYLLVASGGETAYEADYQPTETSDTTILIPAAKVGLEVNVSVDPIAFIHVQTPPRIAEVVASGLLVPDLGRSAEPCLKVVSYMYTPSGKELWFTVVNDSEADMTEVQTLAIMQLDLPNAMPKTMPKSDASKDKVFLTHRPIKLQAHKSVEIWMETLPLFTGKPLKFLTDLTVFFECPVPERTFQQGDIQVVEAENKNGRILIVLQNMSACIWNIWYETLIVRQNGKDGIVPYKDQLKLPPGRRFEIWILTNDLDMSKPVDIILGKTMIAEDYPLPQPDPENPIYQISTPFHNGIEVVIPVANYGASQPKQRAWLSGVGAPIPFFEMDFPKGKTRYLKMGNLSPTREATLWIDRNRIAAFIPPAPSSFLFTHGWDTEGVFCIWASRPETDMPNSLILTKFVVLERVLVGKPEDFMIDTMNKGDIYWIPFEGVKPGQTVELRFNGTLIYACDVTEVLVANHVPVPVTAS